MAALAHQSNDTLFFDLFSSDSPPKSSIDELQSALGPMMLATESTTPLPTGTLSLFSFPRELRDEIYYYYLCRNTRPHYSRTKSSGATWPFQADHTISLLLTSKQVHAEALEVFHRQNEVSLVFNPRLCAAPLKVLDAFPSAHAQLLQRCHGTYEEYNPLFLWVLPMRHFPGECWRIMLRDAYVIRSYFPKLRCFTARWNAGARYFAEQEGLVFNGKSEEEKVQMWLDWMRLSTREMKALPPAWFTIEFVVCSRKGDSMHLHQSSLHEAQARFRDEIRAEMGEEVDLEVLGEKWASEANKEMSRLERQRRATREW